MLAVSSALAFRAKVPNEERGVVPFLLCIVLEVVHLAGPGRNHPITGNEVVFIDTAKIAQG